MELAQKQRKERRPPADKFSERRAELVNAALHTLAELGYARTSLREIAQKSRFSHGVIHYYFSDKDDLIAYCVRDYKAKCVLRYDQIVLDAASYEELREKFASGLAQTLREDALLHRLWYDLRSQALFEDTFRGDVAEIDKSLEDMVWRVMTKAFSLRGIQPTVSREVAYASLDGLFQTALLRFLDDDPAALTDLQTHVREFLSLCCAPQRN
ncbi:transcriptional regulator, TetR family [Mesorhizobium albiziae]|uniref:Transcriptional regulator, TetR family n=1 Tax=Neomesorhizobium albiziae TaxID=335020 RepID=A0A1I3XM35_9HYPH|nr:TetR/AcrR family transcriptional regulator [Mesorhizobium albiziae]GLS30320.1 TetR family transcriptional regulator [Mesorhizobium albiziae]SFK20687.1 transcriptional regulator, TetR family [Mesorhizobium albiziae]